MRIKTLFGTLLCSTYAASGATEPVERYYASMFASYFDRLDEQPSCSTVKGIVRGERLPPRRLLQFYRDVSNPRCPDRLKEDLTSLQECCFTGGARRANLWKALNAFLEEIPWEDAEDLQQKFVPGNLVQIWTCLTWYALCGDHCV